MNLRPQLFKRILTDGLLLSMEVRWTTPAMIIFADSRSKTLTSMTSSWGNSLNSLLIAASESSSACCTNRIVLPCDDSSRSHGCMSRAHHVISNLVQTLSMVKPSFLASPRFLKSKSLLDIVAESGGWPTSAEGLEDIAT